MTLVALTPDLLDRSKVATLGDVRFVGDAAELTAAAAAGDVVVVDLGRSGAPETVGALVARGCTVVAYANHADTGVLDAARAAGADAVPRSVFFRRLRSGTVLGGPDG